MYVTSKPKIHTRMLRKMLLDFVAVVITSFFFPSSVREFSDGLFYQVTLSSLKQKPEGRVSFAELDFS